MHKLEKIMEDIRKIGNIQFSSYTKPLIAVEDVEKIIRKHMNDGWIPLDERLPEEPKENPVFDGKELELYLVDIGANYPLRAFWNGQKFTDGWSVLNVKAWQPLPKRYRPERKCEIE